jgi:formylglycine-generating enzyme required for sulfatase activity
MELIKKKTVVGPGGLVEVSAEELPAGTPVDVSVQAIGSWYACAADVRVSSRVGYLAHNRYDDLGFRCVRERIP